MILIDPMQEAISARIDIETKACNDTPEGVFRSRGRTVSYMLEPAKTERCKVVGFRQANVAVLQNATGPFATSTDLCGGESRKI